MEKTGFLVLQFAVGVVVAIIVMNEKSLADKLIGGSKGIPEWVNLMNPKIKFI